MEAILKLSPQRQLCLPHRFWEALDRPTHFRANAVEDPSNPGGMALILWPGHLLTLDQQARRAGLEPEVLREARRLVEERRRAAKGPSRAESTG